MEYLAREDDPVRIRELLGRQVYSPVRWEQSVDYMIAAGVSVFIEIGPGRTLSNFVKRIGRGRDVQVFNVESPADLQSLAAVYGCEQGTGNSPDMDCGRSGRPADLCAGKSGGL